MIGSLKQYAKKTWHFSMLFEKHAISLYESDGYYVMLAERFLFTHIMRPVMFKPSTVSALH